MSVRARAAALGRAIGLGTWLACAQPALAGPAPLPIAPHSPAARALHDQNVGQDPAAAWGWASVLASLGRTGRADGEVQAFERGLMHLYVMQVAGQPWPRDATVGRMIEDGRQLPPTAHNTVALQLWDRAIQAVLRPVWPAVPPALPDELATLADRLRPLAPGMWARPGAVAWLVTLRNEGGTVLAPGQVRIQLLLPERSGSPVPFDCQPLRGAARSALPPGQARTLICRSAGTVDPGEPGWAASLQRLAAQDPGVVDIQVRDLLSNDGVSRMAQALAAAAPPVADAFYGRFASCESRARCDGSAGVGPRISAPENHRQLRDGATRPARGADRSLAAEFNERGSRSAIRKAWDRAGPRDLARLALIVTVAFALYMAVARFVNHKAAMLLACLVLFVWSYRLGAGQGAASVLIVPMFWVMSVVAVAVVHGLYLAYAWLFFRRRDGG